MRNRIELARHFNKLGFKFGAEIGVYKGEYAEILFKNNPGLELLCVDSWITEPRRVSAKAEAEERLKPYRAVFMHTTSLEAAEKVPDDALDFVFIDADHRYKSVSEDINAWTPKVRKGGIVSGHDYYEFPSGRGGVIRAVDEHISKYGYNLNVIPWDKKNPKVDNRQPCWWFKK